MAYDRTRRPKGVASQDWFWHYVEKASVGCWNWAGGGDGHGYGIFCVSRERSKVKAHRYAYEITIGPIPEGKQLDHLCQNPSCVKPDHLEPVTNTENVKRGLAGRRKALENWAKTHCPQGHPYDEENTGRYRTPQGTIGRKCRACARANERRRLARIRGGDSNRV